MPSGSHVYEAFGGTARRSAGRALGDGRPLAHVPTSHWLDSRQTSRLRATEAASGPDRLRLWVIVGVYRAMLPRQYVEAARRCWIRTNIERMSASPIRAADQPIPSRQRQPVWSSPRDGSGGWRNGDEGFRTEGCRMDGPDTSTRISVSHRSRATPRSFGETKVSRAGRIGPTRVLRLS